MACTNCGSNSQIKISGMLYCASCGKKIDEKEMGKEFNSEEPTKKPDNDLLTLLSSIDSPEPTRDKSAEDNISPREIAQTNDFPEMVLERDEKAYEFYAKNFMDENKVNLEPIPMPSPLEQTENNEQITDKLAEKDIPIKVKNSEKDPETVIASDTSFKLGDPDIATNDTLDNSSSATIGDDYKENHPKKATKSLDNSQEIKKDQGKTVKISGNLLEEALLNQETDEPFTKIMPDTKEGEKTKSKNKKSKSKSKKGFIFGKSKKNNHKKNEYKENNKQKGGIKKIIIAVVVLILIGLSSVFVVKFIENYRYGQIPTYDINESLKDVGFRVNLPTNLPEGYRAKSATSSENKYQAIFSYDPHYQNDYFNIIYTQEKTNLKKDDLSEEIKGSKEWTSEIDKETGIEFLYTSQKIEWIHNEFHYKITAKELQKHDFIKMAKSIKY